MNMQAVVFGTPGGPETLRLASVPRPEPAPGEVLIRVAGAGVNGPDLMQRRGHYAPPRGHSELLGLEAAGEIAALGGGVDGWGIGERVAALCNGGAYAEYVAVPVGQILKVPDHWSLVEAAGLAEVSFTIAQTLIMRAGLAAGHFVLIHGAAGGLGGMGIQIARLYGARPIALVSNPEKAAYARDLGAEVAIDHTSGDWVEAVGVATGGHGADRIIDITGGSNFGKNISVAAENAHILQLASLGGKADGVPVASILTKQLTISGSTLRHRPAATKAAIAAVLREKIWPALSRGDLLKPRFTFLPLAEAAEAHRQMETRSFYGKLILETEFGAQSRA